MAASRPRMSGSSTQPTSLVELRFFGGLSVEDTGHGPGVPVATVEREWQALRAWLYARLTTKPQHDA
jgi:DNA-directed RNA polymerase specialized sigma24 family protein